MSRKIRSTPLALAILLSACGGGGGGGLTSLPVPPPTPTPALTPTPTPPPSPFGVTADTIFATAGDGVEFRWDQVAKAYEIKLQDGSWDRLVGISSGGRQEYYPPSSAYGVELATNLSYTYTNIARVFENGWGETIAAFAYGVPTKSGDMPTTGTARYDAEVRGQATTPNMPQYSYYDVGGTAELVFDFGGGTLQGHMQPVITHGTTSVALPRYDFSQTVYSRGSTTFAGSFVTPGLTGSSSFSGEFTGPQAAELLARWQAPFLDSWSSSAPVQGTMKGFWIGRKRN